MPISPYHDPDYVGAAIAQGRHRDLVGGDWDKIGRLQFDFLVLQGPWHRLVDIGCGCLRGGVHFVHYLDPGHYFGIEMNGALLDIGYETELAAAGLCGKLPRRNLPHGGSFSVERFGVAFDFALAQSLFTHLPMPMVAACLTRVARCLAPDGLLFATFFDADVPAPVETFPDRNPYHFRREDLMAEAARCGLSATYVGEWGHPRGQMMMRFEYENPASLGGS